VRILSLSKDGPVIEARVTWKEIICL